MKRILLAMLVLFSVMQAGITFTTGSRVYIGNATLGVYGNITNNLVKEGSEAKLATIDFLPNSKVSFIGSSNDTITNIYTFPNIEINKPSGSVRLNNSTGNFLLTGNMSFVSGNVNTGTNTFELAATASLTGESTSGYIVGTTKAARVVGTGSSTFGGIGYSMGTGTGNLGTVTVYRYSGDGSEEVLYGSEGIWRKWDVETSNAFSGTRQVTTSWLSGEDNGNVLGNLKVWKYETAKSSVDDTKSIVKGLKHYEKTSARDVGREIENLISDMDDENIYKYEEPKTLGWVEVDGAVFNTSGSPRTATYTIDAATVYTINDVASAFADGAGTEANPYQIATLDQLNNVRNYLSAHYIQIADIDASATSTWNSGAGWIPITSFAGKYNGDGHKISNLYVYRPGTTYVGLFGSTLSGSEIKDLGLENADVTGGNETGAFVGTSRGTIRTSYANGSVNSTGLRVGGFMGYSQDVGSSVNNCYSDVTVTRLDGNSETINFGGFCGRLYRGAINSCYSIGKILYETGTDPTDKGFLGAQSGGTMSISFWNTETSLQSTSAGNATGLLKDQMRTMSVFTNATWDFQNESVNGVEDIWGINATEHAGFPFLSWEGITHNPSPFAGGVGTSDEPFLVSNLTQLDAVRDFLSYNFLQTADIDASPTSTWNSGAGWLPIGNATIKFTGTYDGQGYEIFGLYISRSTMYNGLFGCTQSSIVSDVHLQNADITGGTHTGAIVGYGLSNSTFNRCSANGNITGTSYVGGLAGWIVSSAYISESLTKGSVSGTTYVGGFVGVMQSSSDIRDSYSLANVVRVSGTNSYISAFCPYVDNCKLINNYSTGSVEFTGYTNPTNRGFGYFYNSGTYSESTGNFWNTETSAQSSNSGANATGLSSSEMSSIGTFTDAGWDFIGESANGNEDIWSIHSSINDGYPYLNWEYRIPVEAPSNLALTIGATDVTITWDAVTGATGYLVYSSADPYGTFVLDETGSFNGTEWTASLTGTKMFYYVAAVNDTKIIMAKEINRGVISK